MKKSLIALTLLTVTLVTTAVVAQAQTAAAPAPTAWEKWLKETKNPTPWLNWGADLRLRNEFYKNAATLNPAGALSEQDYFRFRGRLWTTITPVSNFIFSARVAAEPREWMKPAASYPFSPKPYSPGTAHSGLEWRFGIMDQLNVKWLNVLDLPLTVVAGRQDIMLGDPEDWWLVADGTPGDGSWTMFFDAVRLTYDAKEIKTKFDLIYLQQGAHPDDFFPVLGSAANYNLTDQNEQGVILYLSNKSLKNTQVDGYFIYKHDSKAFSSGDNADIYTLGGKITGTPAEHWMYSVEAAYQLGQKQDATVRAAYVNAATDWRDINAYGGKAKLSYLFKDKLKNQVSLVGEYLSGDNPNTKDQDEMFDILWGRYPRWSELAGPFYYGAETSGRGAQMNNLGRIGVSWTLSPIKTMTCTATYNALLSPEPIATRTVAPTRFSNDGNFRGHYVQGIVKNQFSKNMSALLKAEFLWEGDYYAQRSLMTFLRAEVMFTF